MLYEDLHNRYGRSISQRVYHDLTASEFKHIDIDMLPEWLEKRAEAAHEEYSHLLSHPVTASKGNNINRTGMACRKWREAEDLAYLIAIAQEVSSTAKAM